jgi:tricarballylate dehydrogenase
VLDQPWDVVVVGGGNAALVSAMSARDEGARVLVLERAPAAMRGGNSRHTRNVRCVHDRADDYNTGAYTFTELWRDLCGVGRGPSDERLAALTVRESESAPSWMTKHGARWQPPLSGTLHLGRTNRFFLGGGKALLNAYYRTAVQGGITIAYDTSVEALRFTGDACAELVVSQHGRRSVVRGQAFVVASGGFEANLGWLERYWGSAARNYHVRGPHFNDGTVLAELLSAGAARAGDERGFHAVAVDARSPKFDGGIATRLDCIPFGVVVNKNGCRFYDEGEDIWPKRYAIWGGAIAGQADQIAYSLWDGKVRGLFLPPMYGAFQADTLPELARQLGLDPVSVERTVAQYNGAVPDDAPRRFDPSALDGLATEGVTPPKSNWAQRIDQPPFYGVAMRPGITFTYLGVAVTERAEIRTEEGSTFRNLFAAGEIMSGNVLSTGYLAGFGMTIGTVWGRIAGREAARHALG